MSESFFERPSPLPAEIPPHIADQDPFPQELEKFVLISGDKHVFEDILDSAHKNWKELEEDDKKEFLRYLEDLREAVQNYQERCEGLQAVARMRLADPEQMKEAVGRADERRRSAHNSVIDALNILSRKMKEIGLSNSWRARDAVFSPSEDGMREKISKWAQNVSLGPERMAS